MVDSASVQDFSPNSPDADFGQIRQPQKQVAKQFKILNAAEITDTSLDAGVGDSEIFDPADLNSANISHSHTKPKQEKFQPEMQGDEPIDPETIRKDNNLTFDSADIDDNDIGNAPR